MASIYGTLIETMGYITTWDTALQLADSVLPKPFRNHIHRIFSGLDTVGSQPEHSTKHSGQPRRPLFPATQQTRRTGEEAMQKGVRLDWLAEIDRSALDKAFGHAKWWIATVASVAAAWGSPRETGVNWKFGSQAVDLLLSSGHEYAVSLDEDHDGEFERRTYINGAQHVLMGLPRDLDPVEVALLHRVMPDVLTDVWEHRHGEDGPEGHVNGSGANHNLVHIFVFICLCWLYSWAAWLWPKVVFCGRAVIRAEQQRRYLPRLMRAAASLLQTARDALRWLCGAFPCRLPFLVLGYALHGARGGVCEFVEGIILRDVDERKEKGTLHDGM